MPSRRDNAAQRSAEKIDERRKRESPALDRNPDGSKGRAAPTAPKTKAKHKGK